MADAYPLQWPVGRPRWQGARRPSAFKMTPGAMQTHLFEELDRMNAKDVVVSTNKRPYSRSEAEMLEDPGVAVYFKRKGEEIAIACDKYLRVSDNLHAIGLAIESFRSLERHGTGEMVDAAFHGFAALPASIITPPPAEHRPWYDILPASIITPPPAEHRPWYDMLQVSEHADPDVVKSAYRRLQAKYHPDNQETGNLDMFKKIQQAWKESPYGQ